MSAVSSSGRPPRAAAGRETGFFLLPQAERAALPGDLPILLRSLLASALGIAFGLLVFPAEAGLVGVFLVALAQAGLVEALLARNRDDIWQGRESPGRANWRLARSLLVVFLGILLAWTAATLLVPLAALEVHFSRQIGDFGGHSLAAVRFAGFAALLGHNALVAAVGFLCALVYRHGGMLLVLAWNASVWGVVFPYIARTAPDAGAGGALGYTLLAHLCILPHLLLEASAYVAAAMAGVFLSKAAQKYRPDSADFRQVLGAVARIAAAALLLLVAAAAAESLLAPALVAALFG